MNKWTGTIRLTKDAEERSTGTTTVTRFSGACNRRFKQEGQPDADFFDFVAFGKTAETLAKFGKKGLKLLIEAEVRNNNYEKDGVKHYGMQMVVNSFEFCESKGTEEKTENKADGFMPIPADLEELPFA